MFSYICYAHKKKGLQMKHQHPTINVRFDDEVQLAIIKIANRNMISKSAYIRQVLSRDAELKAELGAK